MKKHQGVTLIGFIFFAVCICILGLLVIRIAPVYIKHFNVVHAAQALRTLNKEELNKDPLLVADYLRARLTQQLYVNEIRYIKKKDVKIKRTKDAYVVDIQYEVKKHLIYNVTLLFDFKTKVEVPLAD